MDEVREMYCDGCGTHIGRSVEMNFVCKCGKGNIIQVKYGSSYNNDFVRNLEAEQQLNIVLNSREETL